MSENSNNFFEEIASKRKEWCSFTLDTYIHDVDLPEKIKAKILELNLSVDPDKEYLIEVTFDMKVYANREFYKFPLDRRPWEIEKLRTLDAKEKIEMVIGDVLAEQLKNICEGLDFFSIPYRNAHIIGDHLENDNRVEVKIVEITPDESQNVLAEKLTKKKTKREKFIGYLVVPSRPHTLTKSAEMFAEMYSRKIWEDNKKKLELSRHTPNMIEAKKVFTTLAKAIIDEFPEQHSSSEDLANKLLKQARLKNDWPLEIGYGDSISDYNNSIDAAGEIDCPEYLIYIKKRHDWILKKVNDLDAAKHTILFNGYNQKTVEQVIVLHNLVHLRFNLFVIDNGEIHPISKAEAHTVKKLCLSWCD